MPQVLIAGCGYVGCALAARLLARPRPGWRVFGLRRRPEGLPEGVVPVAADLLQPPLDACLPAERLDAVVICLAAGRRDEAAYAAAYVEAPANLLAALRRRGPLPRLLFTSSTAMYENDDGAWVDEGTQVTPRHFRGRTLLVAEQQLLAAGAAVLRLGGIYGPGRDHLLRAVAGGRAAAEGDGAFGNRIHRDDCAGALQHLLAAPATPPLLLGVDSEPASRAEVVAFLAAGLGRPAAAAAAPATRGKRCRNARLRGTGYALRYPSFRDGYGALLAGDA